MKYKEKNLFQTGLKWLMWSGILTLGLGGGLFAYGLYQNRPPEPVQVSLIPVKLGDIEDTINESGIVELGGQQTLKSPNDATIDQVLVKIGQTVRSGQRLMTFRYLGQQTILRKQNLLIQKQKLTIESSQKKLIESQENLHIAQLKLADYQSGQNDELLEIKKQELSLANDRQKFIEAQEELAAAERELTQKKKLFERGYIPGDDVKSQEDNIRIVQANLRDAQFTINNSLLTLKGLQTKLGEQEKELQEKVKLSESELRKAQLDVSTNIQDLQTIQLDYQEEAEKIQDNILTAPIDGKILNIKVKSGDGLTRGTELLTLGDPTEEMVKLQLSTLNAAKVKPNQAARISIIGPNSKQFLGRVESLFILAGSGDNSGNSQSSQGGQATVPAIVKLDTPSQTLIPGSQVNVEIILQQRQKVVVLNTEVIVREESQPFVWIRNSQGKAQKKLVKLGLEGLTQVEITSGLRPGDQVVIPPPEPPLEPGTPLTEEAKIKS